MRAYRALRARESFKRQLWHTLEATWNDKGYPAYRWWELWRVRTGVTVAAFILVCMSFGTAAYAYTSPEVTEGTPLYPVKRTLEKVEEKLARTPDAQAQFYLKQMKRREAERIVLERQNKKLEQVNEQIKNTTAKLEKIDNQLSESEKEKVHAQLEKQRRTLEKSEKHLRNREKKIEIRRDRLKEKQNDTHFVVTSSQRFKRTEREE